MIKIPKPISIWKPETENGELVFIRPPLLPLGDHYADHIRIPARKAKGIIRAAYFGESAAAGYLFAPSITPAKILQQQLNVLTENGQHEIIDLSRTNERLSTLVRTVEASIQLNPDIIVIFTGNNWTLLENIKLSVYRGGLKERKHFAEQLKEKGFIGPVENAAKRVLTKAAITFNRISQVATENKIPVILVVPEVNLADWENIQPVTWLPKGKSGAWYPLYAKAKQLLAKQNWEVLRQTALQMLELDEWSCPTSYRLLGKANTGLGRNDEAAEVFRAEIDATAYPVLGFLAAPQAGPRTQAFLRKTAKHFNFDLVDLPDLFTQHTGSVLPGRRLFLDYCHLTLEGMQVAMSGVAEKILKRSENKAIKWREILIKTPEPEILPAKKAVAKLGAAIHNAHRLLTVENKRELLDYWSRAAIKDDPKIKSAMIDLLQIRMSEVPATLHKDQRHNFKSSYRLLTQHGLPYDYLDADLIEVFRELVDFKSEKLRLQAKLMHHPAYLLWEPLKQFYPNLMEAPGKKACAYLKAPWPETTFALWYQGAGSIEVKIVLRLPDTPFPQSENLKAVDVFLNEKLIHTIKIGSEWTEKVVIINERLEAGLNRLTIKWPTLEAIGDKMLDHINDRLESGLEVDLHPVFGEIYSLKIRTFP